MSGDSSGRRPEGRGRGRGRDPHRDRTRSRSRSRSPLSSGSRRGAAPERREAPERPSLEEEEPSDSGDEMVDPASLEEEPDHGLCRQIRHQYRALINSVQRKAGRGPRGGRCGTQALRSPAAQRRRGLGRAAGGAPRAPTSVMPIELHDLGGGTQVPAGQDGTAGGQSPAVTRLSPDGQEEGRDGAQTPGSFSCTGAVPRCARQLSSGSVT